MNQGSLDFDFPKPFFPLYFIRKANCHCTFKYSISRFTELLQLKNGKIGIQDWALPLSIL